MTNVHNIAIVLAFFIAAHQVFFDKFGCDD